MRRLLVPLVGLCLPFLAGCQRMAYEKSFTIEKELPYHETEFKGAKSEQKVKVTATGSEPVSIYLILSDNREQAINALCKGRKPLRSLAGEEGMKDATLEGTIPAGKAFVVLILPADPGKETEVKLDVKGQ